MKFENLIHSLIDKQIIPGISILVAQRGRIIFKNQYGFLSVAPEKTILKQDSIYDVASLTKPLVTALLAVYLIDREEISLDTEVREIFPELPFYFKVSHLLTHSSGLVPWYPFYLYSTDILTQFKNLKLVSKPGSKVNYSCPGYILLTLLIEKISDHKFEKLAEEILFKPLKLKNTFFKVPESRLRKIAPTEHGNGYEKKMAVKKHGQAATNFKWRDYMIRGETHDANSFYAGGTAGNSGLFSDTKGLLKLSLEMYPYTTSILKPESTRLFWKNQTPGKFSHRTCGFKLNSSLFTSGGKGISPKAIGHNGFTGTSIWFEPESEAKFILLTNRIHPRVQNHNFNKIRRRLHLFLKKDLNLP